MPQQFSIPGGKAKNTPLAEADAKDIQYWLARISGDLEKDPKKQYADRDRAWVGAARAELGRRSGQTSLPAAGAAHATQQTNAPAGATSNALARRSVDSLSGSFADPKQIRETLRLASNEAHLVAPATECGSIPEGCDIAVSLVWVDPNDRSDGPGDVYSVGGEKLGLAKATLDRIAAAAGITWDSRKSGRLDDGADSAYCMYQAVGYIRNFDGSQREIFGTKEMDLREGSAQLEALWERYDNKKKAFDAGRSRDKYPPKSPEGQVREMRLHILGHAETKARLRAIRSIGIKAAYTGAELAKPFAVARLMWTGRTNDPELKRLFAEKQADAMLNGMMGLYGPRAELAPAPERPLLPRVVTAPPVGSVREPIDDADDYDTSAPDASTAASTPAQESKVEPKTDLPPEQDRGADPNAY